jgi:hypothetical protein
MKTNHQRKSSVYAKVRNRHAQALREDKALLPKRVESKKGKDKKKITVTEATRITEEEI